MPLISVIIPIYNVAEFIEKCLQSVLQQTFEDFELLLVDDCGKDNSIILAVQLLENASRKLDYKVIKREKNGGLSAARNTGIEQAKGKYFYFLDSDDWIDKDLLRKMVGAMQSNNVEIVICNIIRVQMGQNGEETQTLFRPSQWKGIISAHKVLEALFQDKETAYIWRHLYKRELFDQIKFPNDVVFEDVLTQPYLLDKAHNVFFIPDGLYFYLDRQGSISNSINPQILFVTAEFDKMRKYFLAEKQSKAFDLLFFQYEAINMLNIILLLTLRVEDFKYTRPYYSTWNNYLKWRDIINLFKIKDLKRGFWLSVFHFSPFLFYKLYKLRYMVKGQK